MKPEPATDRLVVPVSERDHARGPADAPITLVEYGDYECPWCAKAHPLLAQLRERAGDHLRLVFRHFPQSTIHAHASVAAQAAEAAGAQRKFWEMHDLLFENQDAVAEGNFSRLAIRLELEIYRFESDLSSSRFAARVEQDYQGGQRGGVKKTPTLFINEVRYTGPMELEVLADALNALR